MSLINNLKKYLISLFLGLTISVFPKVVFSAERLIFSVPQLGDFNVSVSSLEDFAKEGIINRDLGYYTQYLDEKTLKELRSLLNERFDYDQVTVSRLTNTAMGEAFLKRLGEVIQVEQNSNGFYALRSSLITVAGKDQGLTLINLLREFPGKDLRLNTKTLIQLTNDFATLSDYAESVTNAIALEAENQSKLETEIDISSLKDLRQKGDFQVSKKTLTLEIDEIRPTPLGIKTKYQLETDLYLPKNIKQPVPLIVISHGFGSFKGKNDLPQHLASYGFAVAIPEHIGSDLEYRKALLSGEIRTDISPMEYLSRPADISSLIDELAELSENQPELKGKIDFNQVGVTGNSLGGTTSLSLGGAEINYLRLKEECEQGNVFLNVSLLLQCRASYLPSINYNLKDNRVKAVAASNPLTSAIFGPEGMSKIDIPTLILGGNQDIITPVVPEQINPFIWLNTNNKYLSLLVPGTHFTANLQSKEGTEALPKILIGDNYDEGRQYFYGLAVAFFKTHLANKKEYLPYLSAKYSQSITNKKLTVYQIKQLTPEQLKNSYQKEPPKPTIPEPIVESIPEREESILTEIKRTKILKVGIRSDAIPFGYIDKKEHSLNGYCNDFINTFATNLQTQLNLNTEIEVIKFYSHLDNRYQLVEDQTIHFECGPNTIREDIENVTFSLPFFISGTNLLIPKNSPKNINPNQSLRGIDIGILQNTTTENFMRQKYPQANLVFFEGENATENSLEALRKNQIDAVANDGILLIGEMVKNNLSTDNYSLIPEKPLTCEYYGLILPINDPEWANTINNFINNNIANEDWDRWFTKLFPYVLSNLDSCFR